MATITEYESGNSQLLKDYRAALLKAYDLGEDIKKIYGIIPPKVLHNKEWDVPQGLKANKIIVSLTIS